MTAYETAKTLMLMRDDEVIDVLDELAINWPNTYRLLVETIKDNADWHLDDGMLNDSVGIKPLPCTKAA